MARLTVMGDGVEREDVWPVEHDIGSPVILPGGEVGMVASKNRSRPCRTTLTPALLPVRREKGARRLEYSVPATFTETGSPSPCGQGRVPASGGLG